AGMIFIARFMNSFLHQASFATGYWCYDRHRSVRLVVLVGLAIDQIAQSGLSSLSVIYYSAQLFSSPLPRIDRAGYTQATKPLRIHPRAELSAARLFELLRP
uniref:hypothetical protein n=1 Tax=Klebsiella pneumoniae TaxID=573 RepID=UPI001C4E2B5D